MKVLRKRAGRILYPAALLAAAGMVLSAAGCGKEEEAADPGSGAAQAADGAGVDAQTTRAGAIAAVSDAMGSADDKDQGETNQEETNQEEKETGEKDREEGTGSYESAPTDLVFWYEGDSYTAFFERAAKRYYSETGVKVEPQLRSGSIDYLGDIYDATMADESFPDLYLLAADNLEEAYLYGLAAPNLYGTDQTTIIPGAVAAATYEGKLLGYPLNYNTCVFVFQSDYFGSAPQSLQEIIDYSDENDPAENVEYLLEWDVNDPFYDFPFISNSVSFVKTGAETMEVVYDEALYQQDLEYFEGILESFSVDAGRVSEESITENFLAGRTLSAIIDTDSLGKLSDYSYALMTIPDLNDTLTAKACSVTQLVIVNDFTMKEDAAADFAYFVTVTMADELHELSGHYSVIPSANPEWVERVALEAYASAVPAPDSQDAKGFWVDLKETILKYF